MTIAALALTATATSPSACQPHTTGTAPSTSQAPPTKAAVDSAGGDVEYDAACDTNNHAVNVKPNTAAARAAAEKACQKLGAAIDNAPWPSGYSPIPLPNH